MKKKLLIFFAGILAVGFTTMYLTDTTYLLKAVRTVWLRGQLDVNIHDFTVQATRPVKTGSHQPWEIHEDYNETELSQKVLNIHEELGTTAFLVFKDGKLINEHYFLSGGEMERTGLWSVTKTFTSLALLKAVEVGYIENIDDPVSKYLPEWKVEQNPSLTLRHLASMSAGLYWDEWDHSPISIIAELNFHNNIEDFPLRELYAIGNPGEVQHYNSGATQLIGTILKRVLPEGTTLSDFISDKFWKPLGCEQEALFILDSKKYGNEKTFGGMVASARDLSRMGQCLLDKGVWRGDTLFSTKEIELMRALPYKNQTYAYGMWTGIHEKARFYFMAGFRGQFCIMVPKHNILITRLGYKAKPKEDLEDIHAEIFEYIEEAIRICK